MVENRFIDFKTKRDYCDIKSDFLHQAGQRVSAASGLMKLMNSV